MKRLIAYMVLLLPLVVAAQTPNAIDEVNRIKADPDYIWGQGRSNMDSKADQIALNDLISKISVHVQSQTQLDMSQITEGHKRDSKSAVEAVIRTYAAGSLTNTKTIWVTYEPEAYVVRYIHKDELEKVFKEREERIISYVYTARAAERDGRIDDALRYYYWGFCLLKSLQHPNAVTFTDDGIKHPMTVWIPDQINMIFGNIKTEVAKIQGDKVDLLMSYKGKPVTSLDFRYNDGQNYGQMFSAKDGITQIEMPENSSFENIHIRYEYEYTGMMRQDRELEMVMDVFNGTPFRKAKVTVPVGEKKQMKLVAEKFEEAVSTMSTAAHAEAVEQPKAFADIMVDIVAAIQNKKYNDIKNYFTEEGFGMFDKLIHYGEATILGKPTLHFYQLGKRVIGRSIPMRFKFKNNHRTFIEDVTFTFNEDKKIESIAFGLDKKARDDIFNRDARGWSDSVRMVVATFLENYKTAFALKRLDYIKSIFDNDALIIVGHMVKKAQKTAENQKYVDNEMVKYTSLNKEQYMKNLERSFKSNEFINIHFSDNDVKKMGKGADTFGILIHQDYYSSNYSDTGYLFLMVDLNDIEQPTIRIRTWQPKRDSSINNDLNRDNPYYGLIYGGNF